MNWNEFKTAVVGTSYLSVDTEGNGEDPREPDIESTVGTALACRPLGLNQIVVTYISFRARIGVNASLEIQKEVKELIEAHPCIVYHNAKHDIVALENLGIFATGAFYDTMLMEHYNNGKQLGWSDKFKMMMNHKLDTLSRKYGGQPKDTPELYAIKKMFEPLVGNKWWGYVPAEIMFKYSANDAGITLELFEKLLEKFTAYEPNAKLWARDQKYIRVISKMERTGIRIDQDFVRAKIDVHLNKMTEIKGRIGLNPNSPKDVYKLLIDQLGLPVLGYTKDGNPSFAAAVMDKYEEEYLTALDSPVAKDIIAFRGYSKTRSANYLSYMNFISPDGRLRANYNLHATVTRRLSVNDPALQQMPRSSPKPWNGDLKQAFIPRAGYRLWELDYSQLELRIIAVYAKEFELIAAFNDPKRDVFTEMAQATGWTAIYGHKRARQMIKTFCYMVSFGAGANKVKSEFGITIEQAEQMRTEFFTAYPGIDKLLKDCMRSWKKNKFIRLWSGRQIRNQYHDKPWAALDYVAQGGGAEIVEDAMIRVGDYIDWDDCKMVIQVHDMLGFEIKIGEEDKWLPGIIARMTHVPVFAKHIKFAVETKQWGTDQIWKLAA